MYKLSQSYINRFESAEKQSLTIVENCNEVENRDSRAKLIIDTPEDNESEGWRTRRMRGFKKDRKQLLHQNAQQQIHREKGQDYRKTDQIQLEAKQIHRGNDQNHREDRSPTVPSNLQIVYYDHQGRGPDSRKVILHCHYYSSCDFEEKNWWKM